ncbi:MAG: hypothetical protein ACFFFG_18480 [Candidatus Thorarchaeota archaeon]
MPNSIEVIRDTTLQLVIDCDVMIIEECHQLPSIPTVREIMATYHQEVLQGRLGRIMEVSLGAGD